MILRLFVVMFDFIRFVSSVPQVGPVKEKER